MHWFRKLSVKSGGPEPGSLSEEQAVSVTVLLDIYASSLQPTVALGSPLSRLSLRILRQRSFGCGADPALRECWQDRALEPAARKHLPWQGSQIQSDRQAGPVSAAPVTVSMSVKQKAKQSLCFLFLSCRVPVTEASCSFIIILGNDRYRMELGILKFQFQLSTTERLGTRIWDVTFKDKNGYLGRRKTKTKNLESHIL